MKPTEFWFWTIPDEVSGKRVRTRWRMTEAQAASYAGAQKVPGTCEMRNPPESAAEVQANCTSTLGRPGAKA
jgi:hypothetical protein